MRFAPLAYEVGVHWSRFPELRRLFDLLAVLLVIGAAKEGGGGTKLDG